VSAGQETAEEQPMTYVIAEPCIGVKDRSCIDVVRNMPLPKRLNPLCPSTGP
jgi:hypothetical protein